MKYYKIVNQTINTAYEFSERDVWVSIGFFKYLWLILTGKPTGTNKGWRRATA